jgi:hypothetical protein
MRKFYDKLPASMRSEIRSLVPVSARRWYAHRNTEVYLLSYPKCGRTWLRLMIGRAIVRHFQLPDDINLLFLAGSQRPHPLVPRIRVVHDDRPMLKAPEELETSKQRYQDKKVILLVRDPRDVIVSSYFEMNKRGRLFGDNPYETRQAQFDGSLSEFIFRRQGGFDTILEFYNIWAANRNVPAGFLLVRYEDLRLDASKELRRVLDFLGLEQINSSTIQEAVDYASFENMRKMEEQGKFQTGMLTPADKSDQSSYKTRRGKIGGYLDYLSPAEIKILNHKIADQLSDIYGYT